MRNLWRHPWRSVATALGIGLGIAAVLATLSVGDNVEANLRSTLQAATGRADLLLTPGASGRAVFPQEPLLTDVMQVPGVSAAYPVLNTRAEPLRSVEEFQRSTVPGVDSGFQVQGRYLAAVDDLPARLSSGAFPEAGSNGIAIGDGFAEGRGIAVGDVVTFGTSGGRADLTVTGLLDDGVGIASTNGGRVGVMDIADLAPLINLAGRVSMFEVQVERPEQVDQVRRALEELA